jgi:hypothetical protein
MGLVRYSRRFLDSCPTCHGVWLDGDEIAEVIGPSLPGGTPRQTPVNAPHTSKKTVYGYSALYISIFMSLFFHGSGRWPSLIVVAVGSLCHFFIKRFGNFQSKRFTFPISILVGLLFLETTGPLLLSETFTGWTGFVTVVLIPATLLLCIVSNVWKRASIALVGYQIFLLAISMNVMASAHSPGESNVGFFHAVLDGAILLGFLHAFSRIRRLVGDGLLIAGLLVGLLSAFEAKLSLVGGAILLIMISNIFHPFGDQLARIGLWRMPKVLRRRNAHRPNNEGDDAA